MATIDTLVVDLRVNTARLAADMQKATKMVADVGRRMHDVGTSMSLQVTAPVALAGGAVLKTATDFEQSMNRMAAVSGATGDQIGAMSAQAEEFGRTTRFSASQAAEAMGLLAMAGFEVNEILSAMPGKLGLAAAAQRDLAAAADLVTNVVAGYRLEIEDLARVNDVLVNAFTLANTGLVQLGQSMKFAASGLIAPFLMFRDEVSAAVQETVEAIEKWLVGRFARIVDAVKEKVDAVTGFFEGMWEKVAGESFVPDMVNAIARHFARLDEAMVRPAERAADRVSGTFGNLAGGVSRSVEDMILRARSLGDVLRGVGQEILGIFTRRLVTGPLETVIGSAIGSILPFQAGGPIRAFQPALVGERGPELFVPKVPGTIVPTQAVTRGPEAVVNQVQGRLEAVDKSIEAALVPVFERLAAGIGSIIPFAHGGQIRALQPALVGERGPELFVPKVPGTIIPTPALEHMQRAGGGTTVNVHQVINVSTGVAQTVRAEMLAFAPVLVDHTIAAVDEAVARRG